MNLFLTERSNQIATQQTVHETKSRDPLVALLLSICPGLGQQYAGRLFRGITSYVTLITVSWLAAIAYMYVTSPLLGLILLSIPLLGVTLIGIDAALCARKAPKAYRLKWYNRPWIYGLVFVTLLLTINPVMDYLVGERIVRAFFVSSASMYPSVFEHDLVVINKLTRPKRGDIVLIKFGENRTTGAVSKVINDQVLRRVIAQEGDTVEMQGREVYINGKLLKENYTSYGKSLSHNAFLSPEFSIEPETVPASSYFVLADARQYGFDSRMFGFVHDQEISGVATKVFWSWNLEDGYLKWNRTAMSLR